MRALRDFNIPKIVTDDMPVFMGLIGDLFPALDVPRKRDLDFEKMCKQAVQVRLLYDELVALKATLTSLCTPQLHDCYCNSLVIFVFYIIA